MEFKVISVISYFKIANSTNLRIAGGDHACGRVELPQAGCQALHPAGRHQVGLVQQDHVGKLHLASAAA